MIEIEIIHFKNRFDIVSITDMGYAASLLRSCNGEEIWQQTSEIRRDYSYQKKDVFPALYLKYQQSLPPKCAAGGGQPCGQRLDHQKSSY